MKFAEPFHYWLRLSKSYIFTGPNFWKIGFNPVSMGFWTEPIVAGNRVRQSDCYNLFLTFLKWDLSWSTGFYAFRLSNFILEGPRFPSGCLSIKEADFNWLEISQIPYMVHIIWRQRINVCSDSKWVSGHKRRFRLRSRSFQRLNISQSSPIQELMIIALWLHPVQVMISASINCSLSPIRFCHYRKFHLMNSFLFS